MVILGVSPLSLEDIGRLSWQGDSLLDLDPNQRIVLEAEHKTLVSHLNLGHDIYGVHSGFGQGQLRSMDANLVSGRQAQLIAYHGCGVGPFLSEDISRGIIAVRCQNLSQGGSGISLDFMDALLAFYNAGLAPAIPTWGSVGASGDLTPMSYLGAALSGDRLCYMDGNLLPAGVALQERGLTPYRFKGREALALMNGTAAMTGIATLAWLRLRRLADLSCLLGALMVEVTGGRTSAFHQHLHERKPHPGQRKVAQTIYRHLFKPELRLHGRCPQRGVIQDIYSIRCMPQVLGPVFDALSWSRSWLDTEINSTSDNPVLGRDGETLFHGGHFFGGHIALACDSLKIAAATLANLWDRQCAYLMGPGNLPGVTPELRLDPDLNPTSHGLKAVQITLSSLCCEVVKSAAAASITTRPTESNNQDIVSLGTHAAQDLSRATDLLQPMAAILGLALNQIHEIRVRNGEPVHLAPPLGEFASGIRRIAGLVEDDRPLDQAITDLGHWLMRPEEILRVETHI